MVATEDEYFCEKEKRKTIECKRKTIFLKKVVLTVGSQQTPGTLSKLGELYNKNQFRKVRQSQSLYRPIDVSTVKGCSNGISRPTSLITYSKR